MTHLRFALLALLLCCLLPLSPSVASAQSAADVAAARDLYIEGAKLSKEGKWAEAKDRLGRSLELKPAPITHYSLAVVQKNLGELVESLENFRAFLAAPREPGTAGLREPAQQAAAELEGRVAKVSVLIKPDGLESLVVAIDGVDAPVAALDRPRLVDPGEHVATASAKGHRDAEQFFTVAEGQATQVSLTLEPAPEQAGTPDGGAGPDGGEPIPTDSSGHALPTAGIVLLATGAAAMAVGIAVGLVGLSEADDAPSSEGEEADAARTKGLVGDIVTGVGAAAAAVGVILLIVSATDDEAEDAVANSPLRPWAQGSVGGLQLSF